MKERIAPVLLAAGVVGLLFLGTPKLEAFVTKLDSTVLPGVSQFALRADPECEVRCHLEAGSVTGLGPTWVRIQRTDSTSSAILACALPILDPGDSLVLRLDDLDAQAALPGRPVVQVEIDDREVLSRNLATNPAPGPVRIAFSAGAHPTTVRITVTRFSDLADQKSPDPFVTLAFERP